MSSEGISIASANIRKCNLGPLSNQHRTSTASAHIETIIAITANQSVTSIADLSLGGIEHAIAIVKQPSQASYIFML